MKMKTTIKKALVEYAKSIDGEYELYWSYGDDIRGTVIELFNKWNGKYSFQDVIDEQVWEWRVDNVHSEYSDVVKEIKALLDSDFVEENEEEIEEYLSENIEEYISFGYDWKDIVRNCSDFTVCTPHELELPETEGSDAISGYILNKLGQQMCDAYDYYDDEVFTSEDMDLDELIVYLDSEKGGIYSNIEEEDSMSFVDSKELVDGYNSIIRKIWEGNFPNPITNELVPFGEVYEVAEKIRIVGFEVIEDENTVAIHKGDFMYHLDYDEICTMLFNTDRKHDLLRDILISYNRQKTERIRMDELQLDTIWVGFKDSLNGGNCRFGTDKFCKDHNINLDEIGGIRADYLLEMETTSFTKRAVQYASM